MILRYFYIDKYNEVAQNLDINLGGKYRFQYRATQNELKIMKNEDYVENLYEEYSVISDVSAILGKNSAGKTTILRMINAIFNGFDIYNKRQYIIIFEKKCNYILYTNYKIIKYNEEIMDKKILCEKMKYFNAIDILKDVGLIYFSNVFDRATPFQGNANLIDISTNYLFENFYKDNINGKTKKGNEKMSIMEEYKSNSILTEIDFLLDIEHTMSNENINLLFDIPTQIEIGFSQVLSDFGNAPFCDNEEYDHFLIEIYKSLGDYLCENQKFDGEAISLFQREMIFYFLFDELCSFCKKDKYNVLDALKCWLTKIENQNWDIYSYYQEILEALRQDSPLEDTVNIDLKEDSETKDEIYQKGSYYDMLDDFKRLCDQLLSIEDIDYNLFLRKISNIRSFWGGEQSKDYGEFSYYMSEAEYLLEEIQDDIICNDYDLYNITCIYEAYAYLEKAYDEFSAKGYMYFSSEEEMDQDLLEPSNDNEFAGMKLQLDSDTENHLDILQKVIKTLMDFTERYDYDVDANMLRVRLDCEDILDFIYNFNELGCKTVVLDTKRNDISSGHSAYLDMCTRINYAKKSGEINRKENVILLIDEGDIYLHPEKQLAYIDNLLKLLQILYKDKKVQLIVTSNSPFIISDIQSSNILYLEKKEDKIEVTKGSILNTFASNVNVLLLDSFFVKSGLIGEYARKKIDSILQDLRNDNLSYFKSLNIEKIIKIIGEPIIRRKLETMLFHNMSYDSMQRQLQYYESVVRQIKGLDK